MKLSHYGLSLKGKTLLDDVNVEFPEGRVNHILGRNGSGKSTLAKSLAGLIAHSGDCDVESEEVTVIGSYSSLPRDLRVEDILALSRMRAGNSLYEKIVERLGIGEIGPRLRVGKLSDGQRQKLKLLFYFAGAPRVVVLDECTGALDRKSVVSIRAFLNEYLNRPGITSLNITHDVSDLTAVPGNVFLLEDEDIKAGFTTDSAIEHYMRG